MKLFKLTLVGGQKVIIDKSLFLSAVQYEDYSTVIFKEINPVDVKETLEEIEKFLREK